MSEKKYQCFGCLKEGKGRIFATGTVQCTSCEAALKKTGVKMIPASVYMKPARKAWWL